MTNKLTYQFKKKRKTRKKEEKGRNRQERAIFGRFDLKSGVNLGRKDDFKVASTSCEAEAERFIRLRHDCGGTSKAWRNLLLK